MRNFSCIVKSLYLIVTDLLYCCGLNLEPLYARQCTLPLSLISSHTKTEPNQFGAVFCSQKIQSIDIALLSCTCPSSLPQVGPTQCEPL